jgi:long-chain-acyl-CoA dehydrogenase
MLCRWEKAGNVSKEVWLKAGQTGLLGVNTPEEFGGLGADYLMTNVTHEEQSVHFGLGCSSMPH